MTLICRKVISCKEIYSDVFSDTFGDASKQILLNCPTPNEVANFNTRKLANILKKASKGRHGTDTVRKVKDLAKKFFWY